MTIGRTIHEQLDAIVTADVGHSRKRVAILGAGIAGLTAAYELVELGHEVVVLEGSGRLGGRAWTHRFANGQYHELGAMRIPTSHDFTRHYVQDVCGLGLRRFVNHHDQPKRSYYIRGVETTHDEAAIKLFPLFRLSPREQVMCAGPGGALGLMAPLGLLTDEIKNSPADLDAIFARGPMTPRVRELETLSLGDFLRSKLDTEEALELVGAVTGLEVWWDRAVSMLVRDDITGAGQLDEVVGGTDRLPTELVAKLRGRANILLETQVTAIHSRADAIHLVCEHRGAVSHRDEDYVLCTIPFSVLRRMDVTGLSNRKMLAIRNLGYTASTKVLLSCSRRFWEDKGILGGGAQTDQVNRQIYYPSDSFVPAPVVATSPEHAVVAQYALLADVSADTSATLTVTPGVLVASYCWGDDAARLGSLTDDVRGETVKRCAAEIHPELLEDGMVTDTASMAWSAYKWSGAAFSFLKPGDLELYYAGARASEGRLYFAGEHCSLDQGWMQGAIRSGLEAVEAIVEND